MTQLEIMLNNGNQVAYRIGASLLGLFGLYIFFTTLPQAARNPVKLVSGALLIVGAGAVFKMLPALNSGGQDAGTQMTGGGAYSMPAPAGLQRPVSLTAGLRL